MTVRKENREKFQIILTEYFNGKIDKAKFFKLDEAQQDNVINELHSLCVDPYWMDYIFHSDDYVNADETTDVDGLVDKIFSYKPILL